MLNEKNFYMIGIGGVSMSALAKILKVQGKIVCGSDCSLSAWTEELEKCGIKVAKDGCPKFVKECDVCVYSGAISQNHPDLAFAKKIGKKIMSRAQLLGEIASEKKCITIAGTHGKTTTTGMIATIMLKAGLDPTIHIGGILNEINSNLHIGNGEYFLTEACEYQDAFLSLKSDISVVLNVEADHMDYFKNIENLNNSFKKFVKNTKNNGFCVINNKIDWANEDKTNIFSFGEGDAFLQAKEIREYNSGRFCYKLYAGDEYLTEIYLSAYGKHNIENSLAAVAVSLLLDVDLKIIKEGLLQYKGVGRRMQTICKTPHIIHDYAHHPTEIKAAIDTLKKIKKNVIVVFQPHTFSRTQDLYDEFLKCFSGAKEVWLLPVYPAREKPIKGVSSKKLAQDLKACGYRAKYISSFEKCFNQIGLVGNDCIVAILGAGDVEKLVKMFDKND